MHINQLSGLQLDYWVAKAEGPDLGPAYFLANEHHKRRYSSDWSLAGPIIEREHITTCWQGTTWVGCIYDAQVEGGYRNHQPGATPLEAAMRCYVESKFGEILDESR